MFTIQVIRIFKVWLAWVILGFGIGFVPVKLLYFICGVFTDTVVAWDLFNSLSESVVDEYTGKDTKGSVGKRVHSGVWRVSRYRTSIWEQNLALKSVDLLLVCFNKLLYSESTVLRADDNFCLVTEWCLFSMLYFVPHTNRSRHLPWHIRGVTRDLTIQRRTTYKNVAQWVL
jgi:hypothetical protein